MSKLLSNKHALNGSSASSVPLVMYADLEAVRQCRSKTASKYVLCGHLLYLLHQPWTLNKNVWNGGEQGGW